MVSDSVWNLKLVLLLPEFSYTLLSEICEEKCLLRKASQPSTPATEKLFPDNSEFLQLGKKCEQRLQYGWLHYLIEMSGLLQCREGLVIKNDEFATTLAFQKYLAVFFSIFKTPYQVTRWIPDKFFLLYKFTTRTESKVFSAFNFQLFKTYFDFNILSQNFESRAKISTKKNRKIAYEKYWVPEVFETKQKAPLRGKFLRVFWKCKRTCENVPWRLTTYPQCISGKTE